MRWAVFAFLLLLLTTAAARADDAAYDAILKDCVAGDKVDYGRLIPHRQELTEYVHSLAELDMAAMKDDQKKAAFINAYNAATLLLVLENDPTKLKSIRDIPEAARWKAKRWKIGGTTYSLDEIENDVLRAKFRDPRVHAAINCASVSCPPLRDEAYEGKRLDAQLDDQARHMVNSPAWVLFENGRLRISPIFDWYAADFAATYGSAHSFILKFADPGLYSALSGRGERGKVEYLEYNWNLNGI
jgi:hypothetical protein